MPKIVPNVSYTTKSKTRARNGQKQGGTKKKSIPDEPQGKLVILNPRLYSRTVTRKFAYSGSVSSSAGGAVALVAASVSGAITGLRTEWTNFAQEYQQFKVLSFKYYFAPATTNATSVTGPYQGFMMVAPWCQQAQTTSASVQQSTELVKFSTLEEKEIEVRSQRFANAANLWNQYNVAYPADRDFGLTYVSVGTLAASSVIFYVLAELQAEFRQSY